MLILRMLADFFAGVFICNCIPHLAAGLRGELFPTPFASPPGRGNSSAVVNVLWGTFNLIVGLLLFDFSRFPFGINTQSVLFILGFLLIGIYSAWHFSAARK